MQQQNYNAMNKLKQKTVNTIPDLGYKLGRGSYVQTVFEKKKMAHYLAR
jgi:hypothetical protein